MNFNGTLSNKYSTVASFVEHYTSNGVSGKIFHFDPFTSNALSSSIHFFLNSIGPYSICIKAILSVGCFVLISNHIIPFISKIFQKLKGIMSKFLEKLIMYIKSTSSGQNSSRGYFNQNSSRVSSNNHVNRSMYASTSSGGNNGGGDDGEDEYNKPNPGYFPPLSILYLFSNDELATLRQILRQLVQDIRIFNGWSTAIGSPSILNRISVFYNGDLSRLNTILNSLEERIDLFHIAANSRVFLFIHSLRIVVNMLNRTHNQFRTIPLQDLQVTRLPYFTLPLVPRGIH